MALGSKCTMSSSSINKPRLLPDALSNPTELIPFAQVRLIAFDLDGTLILNPNDSLGERLINLFGLLSGPGRNVRITLATGRTLRGVSPTVKQLGGFNKVPLVLYNGSVVMQPEKQALVAHFTIPEQAVQHILSTALQLNSVSLYIYTVDPEAKFINDYSSTESVFYVGDINHKPLEDFNGMPVRAFSEMDISSDKVVAALISARMPDEKAIFIQNLVGIPGVSVTSSGPMYVEIRPEMSSKALGLKVLCDRYGIPPENVLAVGDNDNDVELLTWAGLSVSVKNSSDAARASSKFYSNQGAGNAAIEILETVRRAQRLFGRARKV